MKRITFTVGFVTPSFLGGADNDATAEWRAFSIRGQLRWWFRAIAGGYYKGNLAEVRKIESSLFGDTGCASAVRVKAEYGQLKTDRKTGGVPYDAKKIAGTWKDDNDETIRRLRIERGGREFRQNPVEYLAYGATKRSYLATDQEANITIQIDTKIEREHEYLLAKSLWAWLNLGGIGAKSRKGYGSLRVSEIHGEMHGIENDDYRGSSKDDFEEKLNKVLGDLKGYSGIPEWSHFSNKTKIYISDTPSTSWEDTLAYTGSWLIAFRRRYGASNDTRVYSGTKISGRDYEWRQTHEGIPDRAGFGLPLQFGRGNIVTWDEKRGTARADNRRVSPLHIHVLKFENGDYHSLLTHIPSRFIPHGSQLCWRNGRDTLSDPDERHAHIVQDFLDDIHSKRLVKELI